VSLALGHWFGKAGIGPSPFGSFEAGRLRMGSSTAKGSFPAETGRRATFSATCWGAAAGGGQQKTIAVTDRRAVYVGDGPGPGARAAQWAEFVYGRGGSAPWLVSRQRASSAPGQKERALARNPGRRGALSAKHRLRSASTRPAAQVPELIVAWPGRPPTPRRTREPCFAGSTAEKRTMRINQ